MSTGDIELGRLLREEDRLAVLNHKLYDRVLCLGVLHFPRKAFWPHDGGGEDDGGIHGGHQIISLVFDDPGEMED